MSSSGDQTVLTLYHDWKSSAARRVRPCLAEKPANVPSRERREAWLRTVRRPYTEEEIAPEELTPARHPRVAAWWTAIQSRPAVATARIGPFAG